MSNIRSITGLSIRDGVTTLLAIIVWIVTYLILNGTVSSFHSYRLGIVALGTLGISMCALGTNTSLPTTRMFLQVSTFLGFLALATVVYGLIVGTKDAFILLSFIILTLWGIATVRHILFR